MRWQKINKNKVVIQDNDNHSKSMQRVKFENN